MIFNLKKTLAQNYTTNVKIKEVNGAKAFICGYRVAIDQIAL